ncbi:MAG: hypothetical protein PHV33_00010 [Elusimicrobiales bacterium]|nr:hypothetical protein [Elusimicrobiales bacterium]
MKYKSVGIATAAFFFGALCAEAANTLETRAVTSGFKISNSGGKTLESTVGEVSGSTMAAAGKGLRSGHSGTSHSPGVVYDLTASTNASGQALFQWTSVGQDGLSGQAAYVEVKIATYPITYANYSTINSSFTLPALAPGSVEQELYSGLTAGKTYYTAVRVRDGANMYGRLSANATFGTAPVRPRAPVVSGVVSGGNFTISWGAVTSNVAGSTITVQNYEVYYSTALSAPVSGPVTLSSSTLAYSVPTTPLRWYFIKALDGDGFRSDASVWLNNSDEVSRTVADDSRAVVDMSPYVEDFLATSGLQPVLEHKPEYESGSTVVSYRFFFRDAANAEVVQHLAEDVTLILPLSRTGAFTVSGVSPAVSYSAYDYSAYYYNGVEDVKIGGTVNPADGSVSILTRRSGLYKVKQVIRAQSFSVIQTEPRKIFTPNGDGVWDQFNIIYDNPEGLAITDAKVYDLSGAEIASLRSGTYGAQASLAWDGRRSNGDKAVSGIYIYQFKAGSKFYNGTMVVAR